VLVLREHDTQIAAHGAGDRYLDRIGKEGPDGVLEIAAATEVWWPWRTAS
jgi:hypothetical protein